MTVFLTPTGEPFYGGTYFPAAAVPAADGGDHRRLAPTGGTSLDKNAAAPARGDLPPASWPAAGRAARRATLDTRRAGAGASFDAERGGFGAAPKFPSTMSLDLCSRLGHTCAPATRPREIVTDSLDAMASGGMYDHIGGGFARYSVDREWLVPHFEKMLYDQALLVRVYAHAASTLGRAALATGRHRDRRVRPTRPAPARRRVLLGRGRRLARTRRPRARRPVPHVDRRRGRAVLDADADVALEWYGITAGGNFEGRSIPNRLHARGDARPAAIEDARQRLFEAREQRPAPGPRRQGAHRVERLDDRRPRRGRPLLGRPDWIDAAVAAADFLRLELRRPQRALVPLVARRR